MSARERSVRYRGNYIVLPPSTCANAKWRRREGVRADSPKTGTKTATPFGYDVAMADNYISARAFAVMADMTTHQQVRFP